MCKWFLFLIPVFPFSPSLCLSGVTRGGRGGRGGRVTHPWKVLGKFWKGKGGKRERRGKKRRKEKREGRKKGKEGNFVKGEEGNFKWRGKVWKWAEDLFFLLVTFWNDWNLFEVYEDGHLNREKIRKWEMGQFLTSFIFDCTPGYALLCLNSISSSA